MKNYTQEYVAELGIKQNSYSRYENPETDIKSDMLNQIAEILEVTPEQIEKFDEGKLFKTEGSYSPIFHLSNNISYHPIDNDIEKLYKKTISLLEEKIKTLESELKK